MQGRCQSPDRLQGDVPATGLDGSDIGAREPRRVRQLFLRQAGLRPDQTQCRTESSALRGLKVAVWHPLDAMSGARAGRRTMSGARTMLHCLDSSPAGRWKKCSGDRAAVLTPRRVVHTMSGVAAQARPRTRLPTGPSATTNQARPPIDEGRRACDAPAPATLLCPIPATRAGGARTSSLDASVGTPLGDDRRLSRTSWPQDRSALVSAGLGAPDVTLRTVMRGTGDPNRYETEQMERR